MTEIAIDARQQERLYADWVRLERASGGPDPHMTLAGSLIEGAGWQERAWFIGCYLAGYNVPTALAIHAEWPWERILTKGDADLPAWVVDNWRGLSFRRERRAVRTRDKFARHLLSYRDWVLWLYAEKPAWVQTGDYLAAWRDADRIYGTGRYIKLKLLEALRRYCQLPVELGDLRAVGGDSVRTALALLYPQYTGALVGNDSPDNLATAEMCGAWARETMNERYGLGVDWYTLQATLCEYKQAWVGRSQYPGRAQDSELGHYHKIADYWGWTTGRRATNFFEARAALFPAWALGEKQGWDGRRDELGPLAREYGYLWDGATMDYLATREADDWANPVTR